MLLALPATRKPNGAGVQGATSCRMANGTTGVSDASQCG